MIGQTIAHYRITDHLGSGGMGEVFLAEDTKLDRKVALKFLPAHMSMQDDVKARFIQEAKAASALSHPNVCTIYDILESEGRIFIAMEHIEGQTLREKRGSLSEKQALEIGAQIADGLAAAHEKGIVHRDIKSENIMLRKDGIPQIMDFGLAKLRGVSRLTKEGSTLGTVGYMSPEQALGQDVDHRSDIFSLGVVLYELLTGGMPFHGAHDAAIMYEIVNVDAAPPSAIKPDIDPELDRIVLECLEKEPSERYQSAREIAKDLRRFKRDSGRKSVSRIAPASAISKSRPEPTPHVAAGSNRLPWLLAGVLAAALLVSVFMYLKKPGIVKGVVHATLSMPKGSTASMFGYALSLSPDGNTIAFVMSDSSGGQRLWVRSLANPIPRMLEATAGGSLPFWSPDGRHIGFFSGFNSLKTIPLAGGPPVTISESISGPRGATWTADNSILVTPSMYATVNQLAATGGEMAPLTQLDQTVRDQTHRWPHVLPDGEHFLFYARVSESAGNENDAICVGSLKDGTYKRLVKARSQGIYSAGHILYMRGTTLLAQPFDLDRLEMSGDPFPVAEDVAYTSRFSIGDFSASLDGRLVYSTGSIMSSIQLVVLDDNGSILDTLGAPAEYVSGALSPDGERVAVSIYDLDKANFDLWLHDQRRDVRTRLTFDPVYENNPAWSPDGQTIAFASGMGTDSLRSIAMMEPDGTGTPRIIVSDTGSGQFFPATWSPSGAHVLCNRVAGGNSDIMLVTLTDPPQVTALLASEHREWNGTVSPDGRWLAYESDESGRNEIYLTSFPQPGRKWQVSKSGARAPIWRAGGAQLCFQSSDEVSVVDVEENQSALRLSEPRALFRTKPGYFLYNADSQGQRFLFRETLNVGTLEIHLVTDWLATAGKK